MKLKLVLLLLPIFSLQNISFSQKNDSKKATYNDEIPYYYEDGIKWSKKSNTPLFFSNVNDLVSGNTPEEMALDWITKNKAVLKIENTAQLKVRFKRSSLSGHTVRFQQLLNNVPVYNAEIVVHISPKNRVTHVANTFDPTVQNISTLANLSKNDALTLAKKTIQVEGKISFQENHLYVYNRTKKSKLIYSVILEPSSPIGSWEILVDAQNGSIIRAVDKAHYYEKHAKKEPAHPAPLIPVNGTGIVFLSDPLSFANVIYSGNYIDNNDATNTQLDAARTNVTLLDIDLTGGVYSLSGPFADILDFESPFNGTFSQTSSNFSFNRFDDAFEAVNCYYLVDHSMRYINQTLGIPLMPFQYSTGVRYDPHGLNGADNSYYLGGSGRISFGEGGVDDAEDADVVIHELGHGIHDWLTGGSLSQVDGLSEGCGDYWGQSYSRSLGQWTPADPEYNWFFNWDGHNPFWNGRITNYTASYPGGLTGSIHTNGQIWATTLMRIYDILGREKVDKAFLEGLAMTNGTTSQQDAAIAVRQAAIDMGYSCPDIDVFTQEFTATGYVLPALNFASLAPSVSDTTLCAGAAAIINGNGDSLNWYNDAALTNLLTTGTSLNTGQTVAGTYTYYVKYNDPVCSAAPSDTVILTLSACAPTPPTSSLAASDSTLCVGDCIDFSDFSTGSPTGWTWYLFGSATPTSTVQNPTGICYSTAGTYDVALVTTNATGQDSLFLANFITVGAPPTIIATIDSTICEGSSLTISATGANAYTWDNGLGAGQNHTVTPSVNTTYEVTGTDLNGCSNTDQVTITVNPLPTISTNNDTSICAGDPLTISATGATSYTWDNGLGTGQNHTVTPTVNTIYEVTGTDVNGCSNTDQITASVNVVDISTSISALGNTVAANASPATYQWIDCDNGDTAIAGATGQSYTTTLSNGNYAVIVTQNGCIDTSLCVNLIVSGIGENSNNNLVNIYPNPTSYQLNVVLKDVNSETSIKLVDNLGKVVYEVAPTHQKTVIELNSFANGIYSVVVNTGDDLIVKKIVKED